MSRNTPDDLDDQRKMVKWLDMQNVQLRMDDHRPIPVWQMKWESYQDPFDQNRKSTCSSAVSRCSHHSIHSIRNMSSPVVLPDIPWVEPEIKEHSQLRIIWSRLTKLLPWIIKSKSDQYS